MTHARSAGLYTMLSLSLFSFYFSFNNQVLVNRRSLVRSSARPIFFPRIDDSHCDSIHSSLTTVRCFYHGYVGKQQVAWKEYCAEYWLKDLQESMDRCTCSREVTEILLKTALTLSQTTNFRLFQTERSCRRQFQI